MKKIAACSPSWLLGTSPGDNPSRFTYVEGFGFVAPTEGRRMGMWPEASSSIALFPPLNAACTSGGRLAPEILTFAWPDFAALSRASITVLPTIPPPPREPCSMSFMAPSLSPFLSSATTSGGRFFGSAMSGHHFLQFAALDQLLEIRAAPDQHALHEHHGKRLPSGPHLEGGAAPPVPKVAAVAQVLVRDLRLVEDLSRAARKWIEAHAHDDQRIRPDRVLHLLHDLRAVGGDLLPDRRVDSSFVENGAHGL